MSFTPDLPSTEEVLGSILSSYIPPIPPQEQHFGKTLVSWWETDPGKVYIHAEGGTPDDRHYASTLVDLQLRPHGYARVSFDMDRVASEVPEPPNYRKATTKDHCGGCEMLDHATGKCWGYGNKEVKTNYVCDSFAPEIKARAASLRLERTASWPDIMAKAKRLIQSGQVHVLRNGFNYIVGHVVGDHGEYDTELSRDDPSSRAITGWQCSCPWDQYAWQRTRKWKKFEGRPCAHVMALYWKALSTPLDEQLSPEQQAAMGTGQAPPAPAVPDHPPEIEDRIMKGEKPDTHTFGLPRSFGPEGDIIQGDQLQMPSDGTGGPPGPAQAPLAPPPGPEQGPTPSGVIPPFPGEQMEMEWAGPGTTPGGGVSPPGAYSVPGAKPPNLPNNPIQIPGTYSSVMDEGIPPHEWLTERCADYAWALRHHRPELNLGYSPTHAFAHDDQYAYDAAGQHSLPYEGIGAPVQYAVDPQEFENEWLVDQDAADEALRQITGKTAADLQPPQVVKLKNDVIGLAQGPVQGQYGDGQYREVPAVKPNGQPTLGEVQHQDPTTGWTEVIFPLDDAGPHEPYHVQVFCEPSDIEPTNQSNAFIRRHR